MKKLLQFQNLEKKLTNKMNREEILKYVKNKYNTKPDYLWNKYPLYAVLKNNNNKWYGIIMNVPKFKLGLDGMEEVDIIDVKCPPEIIGNLRLNDGFLPAYHMNKEHWITILLDGSVDSENIKELIDFSYELTEK